LRLRGWPEGKLYERADDSRAEADDCKRHDGARDP
jgi:hypothetical protein